MSGASGWRARRSQRTSASCRAGLRRARSREHGRRPQRCAGGAARGSARRQGIVISAGTHLSVALRTLGGRRVVLGLGERRGAGWRRGRSGGCRGRCSTRRRPWSGDRPDPRGRAATGDDAEALLRQLARGDADRAIPGLPRPDPVPDRGPSGDGVAGEIIDGLGREMARWVTGLRRRFDRRVRRSTSTSPAGCSARPYPDSRRPSGRRPRDHPRRPDPRLHVANRSSAPCSKRWHAAASRSRPRPRSDSPRRDRRMPSSPLTHHHQARP